MVDISDQGQHVLRGILHSLPTSFSFSQDEASHAQAIFDLLELGGQLDPLDIQHENPDCW